MPPEVTNALVAIFGTAGAPVVIWLWRRISRFLTRMMKTFEALQVRLDRIETAVGQVQTDLADVKPAIALVNKELRPNGGQSLTDKVNAIRTQVLILESRGRAVWAADDTPTYECDGHGQCIWSSAKLCELFGLTFEEMLGNGWLAAVHGAEERKRVHDNWREAVEAGTPYEDVYQIFNRKTHESFLVRTYTTASKDVTGAIVRYFGVVVKSPEVAESVAMSQVKARPQKQQKQTS